MVRYIYILLFLMILNSCYPKRFNQKYFSLNDNVEVQEIKTNGYYYSVYDLNKSYYKHKGRAIKMNLLLKNGYFHFFQNGYGDDCGDTITVECDIMISESMLDKWLNREIKEKYKGKSIWNWGKYEIKNDTILIQWYYNRFGDYYLVEERGVVLDSTSFRLNRIKDYRTKEEKEINELYQFKPYDVSKMYDKIPENL